MTSSHNLAAEQESALDSLHRFVEARRDAKPVEDFERFEVEIHSLCANVEREIAAAELARLDMDVPVIEIEGVAHRQVLRCEETYFGAAGPLRVMRSLYSTRVVGERAVSPMELRAGLVEGRWTPLAAKQATWAVAHLTPQEGEDLFKMLGGMTPSKSSLDRLPKQLSEQWEGNRKQFEEALRVQEPVPERAVTVAISLDGVMVPMKDGDRQAKRSRAAAEGRETRGPAGYQEAGCGTISFYDREGQRLATKRMGRMPEHKKATLKAMLRAELIAALEQRPDLQVVKVADGAKDNWTYLSDEVLKGVQTVRQVDVVDFYHGAEQLHDALEVAYGKKSPQCTAQFEKLRHILREEDDGVEKVIRALVYQRDRHPRRKVLLRVLKYFRRNRHRMHYAKWAAEGLPIGSGVVEAACKTLATQRMKRSGMRWREQGGQAILTFRGLCQSDRYERAWSLLSGTYKLPARLPENVVAFTAHRVR
jgi:hypothetical protein